MGATKKTVGTYFWTSNFLPQHPRALRTNFLDSGTMYSITYCMGNLFMVFKSRASTQEIISSITKTGCLCETVVVLEMISWGSALGIYNRTPNNSLIAGLVSTRHKDRIKSLYTYKYRYIRTRWFRSDSDALVRKKTTQQWWRDFYFWLFLSFDHLRSYYSTGGMWGGCGWDEGIQPAYTMVERDLQDRN